MDVLSVKRWLQFTTQVYPPYETRHSREKWHDTGIYGTSTWGIGIDNQRMTQWRVKDLGDLDTLYQRLGSCARDAYLQGVCILFQRI